MPGRLAGWLGFVLALTALAYAARLADTETPDDLAYRWSSSVAAIVQYGLMLGVLLLIARGLPKREMFALRRPASWPRALGLAFLSLLAIWAASAALAPFLDASDEQGLVPDDWDSSRAGAFVAFVVTGALHPTTSTSAATGRAFMRASRGSTLRVAGSPRSEPTGSACTVRR